MKMLLVAKKAHGDFAVISAIGRFGSYAGQISFGGKSIAASKPHSD